MKTETCKYKLEVYGGALNGAVRYYDKYKSARIAMHRIATAGRKFACEKPDFELSLVMITRDETKIKVRKLWHSWYYKEDNYSIEH